MRSVSSDSDSDSAPRSPPPLSAQIATQPLSSPQIQLINIKSHVPVVLDLHESNYGVWRQMFHAVFAKFGLTDHIDDSTARGDSEWIQNDFSIVSWIYVTVSGEILQMVHTDDDTAYVLWHAVRSLFRNNKEARSIYVSAEFRNLYQGDMTVLAYCTKMKTLANTLHDLGAPVEDRDLVLNVLRGLNPRFHGVIPTITMHPPLPSFLQVRSSLLLEEHRLAQSDRLAQYAALLAQAPNASPLGVPAYFGLAASAPFQTAPPPSSSTPSSSSTGGKKSKPKKKNTDGSTAGHNRSSSSSPAPPNSMAGLFQAWPMQYPMPPTSAGVLGARPGVNLHQAYHVAQHPQPATVLCITVLGSSLSDTGSEQHGGESELLQQW
ncbi:uncharacterized protein LOC133896965 [Phragmites australis]|uniref:uncharacterized protein LOC133896965 n=1 Tax=Phragmites australis TaxID=29695 RepID=UPI002D791F0C|nr:uncharacterized protein LOC133896965 [Phragmites australis]